MFDEALCEQGRNFSNKIWNAFRLVKGWEIATDIPQPEHTKIAIEWFTNRLNEVTCRLEDDFAKYRLSEALINIYKLIWDDFCSTFLEIVKPAYQHPIDAKSLTEIIEVFDQLLRLLHPFMPFITEELWQNLVARSEKASIMFAPMPTFDQAPNEALLTSFENTLKIVEQIRRIRAEKNIAQKIELTLNIIRAEDGRKFLLLSEEKVADGDLSASDGRGANTFLPIIQKLCNLSSINHVTEKHTGAISFIENNIEYCIPITDTINVEAELEKLQEELKYTEGFLQSVLKKLSNERFVTGAPEQVVASERKKQADAETKIAMLREQIAGLGR